MQAPWILVLCHEFPPLGGGAGKNLFLLCRELTRRGVRVKVWTGDPGARNRWDHAFEVEYIRVGRKGRFETRVPGMLAFAAGALARALRRTASPPALVFSNLGIPAGFAGTLVSRRFGVPHAVWYQGSDVHAGRASGASRWQRLLLRWIAGGAARNFYVSPGLRDMARGFGPVPNATLLPTCPSPEILAAAGKDGGVAGAARYFLFLGRFDEVKNPLLVAEAAGLLKAGALRRPLRMVGGGDLAPRLLKLVRMRALAERVIVEGAASFERVPALLQSAYALIVPSRIEGFNTTILEAARFGVPSIGSDTVGIRDFIVDGETGLLFSENDAASLAESMRALDGDPALRDRLGARAREAARPYHPGAQAEAFLSEVAKSVPALEAAAASAAARAVPAPEAA